MSGEAKNKLKSIMQQLGISSSELIERLQANGSKESKSAISSKISRGKFSADFFLQCLRAMRFTEFDSENFYNQPMDESCLSNEQHGLHKTYEDSRTGLKYISISEPDTSRTASVVSLFSGAGGFDVGLEQAGFETLACIDFDDDCRETLAWNRPNWNVVDSEAYISKFGEKNRKKGDIRKITTDEILAITEKAEGAVDLIVGGAPCQPFSNMGKKQGRFDENNGDLFLDFVRFVKGLKPKGFIFENVAGITQSRHNDVIAYMKRQFCGLDYSISTAILNAANYGTPQRRERFFMIGIIGNSKPAFPLPTHYKNLEAWNSFIGDFDVKPVAKPSGWTTVEDAFSKLPKNRTNRCDYAVMNISDIVRRRMKYIGIGQNFKVVPQELLPNCWTSGKHLGSDTFGRLDPNLPSVTIRTAAYNPSKGRYIHPYEDRGLDTAEMAILQDFPQSWEFRSKNRTKVTLVSAGKQIGNAVPPSLAKALGLAVLQQIK